MGLRAVSRYVMSAAMEIASLVISLLAATFAGGAL
jgi:hypothetical protein